MKLLIDTNAFLEVLLADANAHEAKQVLENVGAIISSSPILLSTLLA